MLGIVWRVRLAVADSAELWQEWETAGDRDLFGASGKFLCRLKATPVEREAARSAAERRLETLRESRRSVLSELNSKAQTYGTIQAGITALFGFGLATLITVAPYMRLGIISLGVGILLSVIAICMLRWMAVAGNKKMWTKRSEDAGVRALRESRFEEYVRLSQNCNDMIYVVQKRRRLFMLVAIVTILADIIALGWTPIEAMIYFVR